MTDSIEKPGIFPWPPVLLVGCIVVPWMLGSYVPLPWPGMDDVIARGSGFLLIALGLALVVWSISTLIKHGTTTMPHKGADKLVTDGPFAWRRNPIYLGDAFILLGLGIVLTNLWFVISTILFVLLVTWLAVLPEERHLEATFGDDYLRYKETVRRWI